MSDHKIQVIRVLLPDNNLFMAHIVTYTDACGSKINNNDERTHFFRKIYLSLYSKGLRKGYVWEVNKLTPSSSVFSSTSFLFCWAAQLEGLRAQPSAESWVSLPQIATTDSKLTELPVTPGYIIVWCPPASCECRICTQFNPSTVKVIPWYLRPDAPVPWLMAGSEVNMLQYKGWNMASSLQRNHQMNTLFRELIQKKFMAK